METVENYIKDLNGISSPFEQWKLIVDTQDELIGLLSNCKKQQKNRAVDVMQEYIMGLRYLLASNKATDHGDLDRELDKISKRIGSLS